MSAPNRSPDCRQGKCRACTGLALDPVADDVVECECDCHQAVA